MSRRRGSLPLGRSPVLVLGILLGLLAGCHGGRPDGPLVDDKTAAPAGAAAEFHLRDLKGAVVRLSDYRGKVVLLSFWATWCEPCLIELPQLQRLWKNQRDRGLVLLSVAADPADNESAVRQTARRYRFEFPVLLDPEGTVIDRFDPTMDLPFGVVLDRSGVIRFRHQGYRPGDETLIEHEILELLQP